MPRALLALTLICAPVTAAPETRLSVMSFNIWGGGSNSGSSVDATVAVLRAANADFVALQETRPEPEVCDAQCPPAGASVAPALAEALGYHLYEQSGNEDLVWANAILSRYPVARRMATGIGALFEVDGRTVAVINVHLPDWPYQPYQLLGIEYGGAPFVRTAEEATAAAGAARGAAIDALVDDLESLERSSVVFVCGDFNEPSHRDWTEASVAAGLHPLAVAWPAIRRLEQRGFVDSWRAVHPDEVRHPGWTWTPRAAPDDPRDHPDRIDFVLVRGAGVEIDTTLVVGEAPHRADMVVTPWPSDHRAVLTRVRLGSPRGGGAGGRAATPARPARPPAITP